eukprot:9854761-Heterocapsa_arctica.AAC.1
MEGGHNTAKNFERMAGQNDAKPKQKPQRAPPWGAPQGPEAPGVLVSVVDSHRYDRPRARDPLC